MHAPDHIVIYRAKFDTVNYIGVEGISQKNLSTVTGEEWMGVYPQITNSVSIWSIRRLAFSMGVVGY
jgi:hypothetical protein